MTVIQALAIIEIVVRSMNARAEDNQIQGDQIEKLKKISKLRGTLLFKESHVEK